MRPRVAFVAGGGAVRGLAHLGVLRACEELGVTPEIFVGTGTGALIGAAYAEGVSVDVLLDAYRLPWRRRHRGPRVAMARFLGPANLAELTDPGRLFAGAFSLDGLERYLANALPQNDFRSLAPTLLVTAVDIDTAERVVFGRGHLETVKVSRALTASCCLPGLFRPYGVDGRYYLAGELARQSPAELAAEAGADIVIVSNVHRPASPRPGGRSVARRGVVSVVTQAANILLDTDGPRHLAPAARAYPRVCFLDIAPDVGEFGYLDRFAARALVMRGYGASLRVLAKAKREGVFDERAGSPRGPAMN